MICDITVIIATYNRAQELARTLDGMVKAEKRDLGVEFVVVDNGSIDGTKSIVDSYSKRIPVRYIFEARSGKNRALNTALEKITLGKIIVFTDDDVDVPPGWLVSIVSVCERWPDHAVFGGRIKVVFPSQNIPSWASNPYVFGVGFADHNYSKEECIYGNLETPSGANYWVRREVFDCGRRFNEAIGPHPKNRIMGSETTFLFSLVKDGYEIVYSPAVVVGHRIQKDILKRSAICLRAYRLGRGVPHIYGLPQSTLLKNHPAVWHMYRCGAIIWNSCKVFLSFIFSSNENRLGNCVWGIRNLALHIESMGLAKNLKHMHDIRTDF